ncbi:MAG: ATP-dependent RNA helicase DbpA [Myxococcota bacterium]
MAAFDALALSPALIAVVGELGYTALTPIQQQCIPLLLAGKDVIGQSKTGSGKTAAFALPILQRLDVASRALQAIVLCPTRELAAQVAREIRTLGRRHAGLQVLTVSGGEPLRAQVGALERGVHVVVGTPGRIVDHLRRGTLPLHDAQIVVLDEADRMLDMGFAEAMQVILEALPATRQTAMFSATYPQAIASMSHAHQREAVRVTVDAEGPAEEIEQLAVTTEPGDKLATLLWVLDRHPHESVLVFCNLKRTVRELAASLATAGVSVDCLHGDLEQFHRDRVVAMLRNGSLRAVVATDVAARGLDIAGLDLVVNYDLPAQSEVYVHRTGRTGRAGRPGLSVALLEHGERRRLAAIERHTGASVERVVRPPTDDRDLAALGAAVARPAAMDTVLISGGRKDKVRPGDILGALTGEAGGFDATDIGKIEIHPGLSYVAVAAGVSRRAVMSLNNGRIKGRRFRASFATRFKA